MIGAPFLELDRQPRDLKLEVVAQPEADVDVAPPRVRDLQAVEPLAVGQTEQIRHRARMPEGDQRRVDTVLQRRAMPDQVQTKTRERALATDARVGQPDRRHQIAPRQVGQHPGIASILSVLQASGASP